jgi:Fe-S cluster biogenesis protein NfuA
MMDRKEIAEAIDEIRPRLQADGGDIELVDVMADGTVSVRLMGACGSCPMALMTLKHGVESFLKDRFPQLKEVVQA